MRRLAATTLVERLERHEEVIAALDEAVDAGEVAERRRPQVALTKAEHYRRLGLITLVLDQYDYEWPEVSATATDQFNAAVTQGLRGIRAERDRLQTADSDPTWIGEPVELRDTVYAALLADDTDLVSGVTDEVDAFPESHETRYPQMEHWAAYVRTLARLCRPDADNEGATLPLSGGPSPDDAVYSALAEAVLGIWHDDPEQMQDGIAELVTAHTDRIEGSAIFAREVVCFPGIALVTLARRRGMSPEYETQFLPVPPTE